MNIPEQLKQSLERYVTHRLCPGQGLSSIISNDLFATIANCDDQTLAALRPIVTWLHNFAPVECHGSKEKLASWIRL